MPADSRAQIELDLIAQAVWLRRMAKAKAAKVRNLVAIADNLEIIIMARLTKLFAAEDAAVDAKIAAAVKAATPPPDHVLSDEEVTALNARLAANKLDANGDPLPQQA